MLVVFLPIFVTGTKIIFRYHFAASLNQQNSRWCVFMVKKRKQLENSI